MRRAVAYLAVCLACWALGVLFATWPPLAVGFLILAFGLVLARCA